MSELLRGSNIDSLENVLMLQKDHHDKFGSMLLWFTDRPVQPIIATNNHSSILIRMEFTTFTLRTWEWLGEGTEQCRVWEKRPEIRWI